MPTENELSQMTLAEIRALEQQELNNPEQVETEVFQRRVVDPDGVERIYEGDSPETLIDSIVEGRSVHQPAPIEVQAPKELTPDEEFCLAQEFSSSPSKTFRKMAESEFGAPIANVKASLQKLAQYESATAAEEYVAQHPEYNPIPRNGNRIQSAMKAANLPITVDNIAKTVKELDAKGLLEHKPAEFDPFGASLQELKARANNSPVASEDVAGSEWIF